MNVTDVLISILILVSMYLVFRQHVIGSKCNGYKKKVLKENFNINDMYTDESMNVFKDIPFSLECCPSTYSNDKGCACITGDEPKTFCE